MRGCDKGENNDRTSINLGDEHGDRCGGKEQEGGDGKPFARCDTTLSLPLGSDQPTAGRLFSHSELNAERPQRFDSFLLLPFSSLSLFQAAYRSLFMSGY